MQVDYTDYFHDRLMGHRLHDGEVKKAN